LFFFILFKYYLPFKKIQTIVKRVCFYLQVIIFQLKISVEECGSVIYHDSFICFVVCSGHSEKRGSAFYHVFPSVLNEHFVTSPQLLNKLLKQGAKNVQLMLTIIDGICLLLLKSKKKFEKMRYTCVSLRG